MMIVTLTGVSTWTAVVIDLSSEPSAAEVVDSSGRRNITFQLIEDTGLRLPPGFSIEELCVALN
jgi:hypothetical protein